MNLLNNDLDYNGRKRENDYCKPTKCEYCNGTGRVKGWQAGDNRPGTTHDWTTCPHCGGKG